jgi:hypothetical protein
VAALAGTVKVEFAVWCGIACFLVALLLAIFQHLRFVLAVPVAIGICALFLATTTGAVLLTAAAWGPGLTWRTSVSAALAVFLAADYLVLGLLWPRTPPPFWPRAFFAAVHAGLYAVPVWALERTIDAVRRLADSAV